MVHATSTLKIAEFCYTKVRYRGLAKNTAQLRTLFALANLWMARQALLIELASFPEEAD
jgi:IS5 family transposase